MRILCAQAKETTQIPDEVLKHKTQIKKERIGLEQITNKRAKEILKRLGYNNITNIFLS